jgi:hypothetical protein
MQDVANRPNQSSEPTAVGAVSSAVTVHAGIGGGSALVVRHHDERRTKIERQNMNIGLVGGIVGSLIGIAGGVIGTYFGIKNMNGPRERAFMIRSAIVCCIGVVLFFAVTVLLPQMRLWIAILCVILFPFVIRYMNKRQKAIRGEEQTNA